MFVSIWLVCVEVDEELVEIVLVAVVVVLVIDVVVVAVTVVDVVIVVDVSAAFSRQIHHPPAAPPAAVPNGIQLIASFVRVSPTGDNDPLYLLPFTYTISLSNSVEKPQTLSLAPAGPKMAHALSAPVGYAPG